jgi:hypothetical protein
MGLKRLKLSFGLKEKRVILLCNDAVQLNNKKPKLHLQKAAGEYANFGQTLANKIVDASIILLSSGTRRAIK